MRASHLRIRWTIRFFSVAVLLPACIWHNESPRATIDSPPNGAEFTTADSVAFAGTATDPEDGNLSGTSLVWTSSIDGELGVGRSFSTTLSEGSHAITLTATDSDGKTDAASITVEVTSPTTNQPPTAAISSPSDGANYQTTDNIEFAGAGTDPEDGDLSGASLVWNSSIDSQIGLGSSFSATLSEGTHTITLTATDSDGATGAVSITVEVTSPTTNQPPAATISVPSDGATYQTTDNIEFAGAGTDPEDGALGGASLVWTSSIDSQIGVGSSFSTTLSEGTHTIILTVTDSDGATGAVSITVEVTWPTTNQPPTAVISAPSDGATYQTTDDIEFAGAGTDPEDGALANASLVWTSSIDSQIGVGTSFSTTLSEGTHTITLTVTDSDGATGGASITLEVTSPTSNQPPTAAISAPSDGATYQITDDIEFAGTGTDPEDGDLSGASLVWTSSIDGAIGTGTAFSRALSAGSHLITLTVTDSGSLTASASVNIEVQSETPDTIAPVNTTGLDFINGGAASADNPDFSLALSAEDNVAVTAYYVAFNTTGTTPPAPEGSTAGWVSLAPTATFSEDVAYTVTPGLPDGSACHIYVWFKDAAGNVSGVATDSIVSADSTPPVNTTSSEFINNGSPTTTSENVTLALAATDNWGVAAYYVAENATGDEPAAPDVQAAGWTDVVPETTYDANVAYALSEAYQDGDTLFLFVWFKDGSGNLSGPASDSIAWSDTAYETIYRYGFEDGWDIWWADNGVWQIGTPSAGPATCYEGAQCAGTVLDGNYPGDTDSRLVGPTVDLPAAGGNEEIQLRFWQWFSYAGSASCDAGYVQVRDRSDGSTSAWTTIGRAVADSSPWSMSGVDLTAYAGKKVQIAFYHTATTSTYPHNCRYSSTGWYLDDIQILKLIPEFTGDFETGWRDWSADRGVWQAGTPAAGPDTCHTGSQAQCVGTNMDGDYPGDTDSRLVSPTVQVPTAVGNEEVHLRFWQWFSYTGSASCDVGYVQIRERSDGEVSAWTTIGNAIADSSPWSMSSVDLTAYAGKRVQIAFYHTATTSTYPHNCRYSSTGWYLDEIQILKLIPEFTGDFETGWGDWSADRGVWQVGTPAAGPETCHAGEQCAGTNMAGNYPGDTDSRLVSPTVQVPTVVGGEEVHLRFWQWFSYTGSASCDVGHVQIRDRSDGETSAWTTIGNAIADSSPWSMHDVDLTAYAGKRVQIAFYHTATTSTYPHNCRYSSTGWYVDQIELVAPL